MQKRAFPSEALLTRLHRLGNNAWRDGCQLTNTDEKIQGVYVWSFSQPQRASSSLRCSIMAATIPWRKTEIASTECKSACSTQRPTDCSSLWRTPTFGARALCCVAEPALVLLSLERSPSQSRARRLHVVETTPEASLTTTWGRVGTSPQPEQLMAIDILDPGCRR